MEVEHGAFKPVLQVDSEFQVTYNIAEYAAKVQVEEDWD